MGTFTASLRAIGDVNTLPAVVEVEDGRISIASGDTEIGSWPLADIHLEPIPTGYRMAAEGDQILLEFKDVDSFTAALSNGKKRRIKVPGRAKAPKEPEPAPKADTPITIAPVAPVATATPAQPARVVALPPQPETVTVEKKSRDKGDKDASGIGGRSLAFVDGTLSKASKRFGPYLPEWMFTRVMFGVAFVALILTIVLPGLVSTFMLIAGALMVVFGAVVYSDPMLASRWLPGRTTPPHVLLFGVIILMLGVLLGVISR
ncbi:MAG TPA: hypothetical protein VI141_09120 [Acidimicrobiia bacterium]